MSWFSFAESGQSSLDISRKIKRVIRTDPFFIRLFKKYDVPIDKVNDLVFKIKDLRGRHAQSNSKEIHLNSKLFEDGNFIKDRLHFVVHELIHWLTRQREKNYYFSDPEEIEAFTISMAYEIKNGKNKKQIFNTFFPIIKAHFENQSNAIKLFNAFYDTAVLNSQDYCKGRKENESEKN